MKIDTVVSGIKNLVNNEWLRRTGKALLYALHVVVHPFDGFWDLKNEKLGTASAATIIVILVLMTRLLSLQFTSFQFMEVNWEKISIRRLEAMALCTVCTSSSSLPLVPS